MFFGCCFFSKIFWVLISNFSSDCKLTKVFKNTSFHPFFQPIYHRTDSILKSNNVNIILSVRTKSKLLLKIGQNMNINWLRKISLKLYQLECAENSKTSDHRTFILHRFICVRRGRTTFRTENLRQPPKVVCNQLSGRVLVCKRVKK